MHSLSRLIEVMDTLRDPERGCPWDRAQTFRSLLPYTIEEVYELVDAVERQDKAALLDELGDLLFHVVFYARIASEAGEFGVEEVASGAAAKLEQRHPHVFGDAEPLTEGHSWERMKLEQRRKENAADAGVLAGVPDALPALVQARKLQHRAAAVGFDWPDWKPVLEKLEEEITELKEVLDQASGESRLEEEIGDILFAAVNCARHAGVDPELALYRTNRKFLRRFGYIERTLAEDGRTPGEASLEEMDRLWDQAKLRDSAGSD